MKQLLGFLRTVIAHPKTTGMGIAAIGAALTAILHDHSQLANPLMWTGLLTGLGLLLGADGQPPAAA